MLQILKSCNAISYYSSIIEQPQEIRYLPAHSPVVFTHSCSSCKMREAHCSCDNTALCN
jgi:hypothetical protein